MPEVTTLLRASRDADEDLLAAVLKEISEEGITKDALNEDDCSGRVGVFCLVFQAMYTFYMPNVGIVDGALVHLFDEFDTHLGRISSNSWIGH